jgi:hypothetical protein
VRGVKMATLNLKVPAVIKIENTSEFAQCFIPFGENFNAKLAAGAIIEFKVNTSNEVIYYINQATPELIVTVLAAADGAAGAVVLNVPAKVTLTNIGTQPIGFIPFKQNFKEDIAAGNIVELTTTDVNQVLYYMAQAVEGKLTFAQEAVE